MTGIAAEPGTAESDETPGMTSNGDAGAASASASSPPRPKTNGSPPFSRTTRRAAAAVRDEQTVDVLLVEPVALDAQRVRGRLGDELGSDEPVEDDHLAGAHAARARER